MTTKGRFAASAAALPTCVRCNGIGPLAVEASNAGKRVTCKRCGEELLFVPRDGALGRLGLSTARLTAAAAPSSDSRRRSPSSTLLPYLRALPRAATSSPSIHAPTSSASEPAISDGVRVVLSLRFGTM